MPGDAMKRCFKFGLAIAITLVYAAAANAQHGHHHHHHNHQHPSSWQANRVVVANYGYGNGYGYSYRPFVSYEESVLRGMGYYSVAQAQSNAFNAQANVLNAQAVKIQLENELTAVKNRAAKGAAIAEGKAAAAKAREERLVAVRADNAARRKSSLVEVDITRPLSWPEALEDATLATHREQVHDALGGDRRYVGAGDPVRLDEVKQHAKAMFAEVLARREQLGDSRVVAAKRYLDGLVRAAEGASKMDRPVELASR
jgi:hypothetical protein